MIDLKLEVKQNLSDTLWDRIEGYMPPEKPRRFQYAGRKPYPVRVVMEELVNVIVEENPWAEHMGQCSGIVAYRLLTQLRANGVWKHILPILEDEFPEGQWWRTNIRRRRSAKGAL